MKTLKLLFFVTVITFFSACEKDLVSPNLGVLDDEATYKSSQKGFLYNATGSVEIEWKGANKGGDKGNKPDALLTFFDFNAKQKDLGSEAKGEMVYLVLESDFSPHREIRAEVKGLHIDKENKRLGSLEG